MFATDNDYEEAIRGASIHAFEQRENRKRVLGKLLYFMTGTVLLYIGFSYYKEGLLQEVENFKVSSESLAKNILDNSQLTKKVLEIGSEESIVDKSEEDEYLTKLQYLSNFTTQNKVKRDEYLIALDNMEVDILDDSQPKSISSSKKEAQDTDLNLINLNKAIGDIVNEAIVDNSKYTNYLKKSL